ncbi:MAG: AI-2E family transporter [Paracoccus sp. (in: a-proteobacteria)]|nr:AI-2E family transporter [Paracoccus sp. (in: a-proteobacteria)]
MRITARQQALWWGVAALVLTLMLWRLGNAVMPFVLGAGIAYLLNPVANRLERAGLSRALSVALISVWVLLMLVAMILWVAPLVVSQMQQLFAQAPEMLARLQGFLSARLPGFDLENELNGLSPDGLMADRAGEFVGRILGSLLNIVSVVALLVIAPVVAFYLLLDWDHMMQRIDQMLPREHLPVLRELAADIDDTLAGFVRGQMVVMLILGTLLSTGLYVVGLPYAVAIGIISALLSVIPYVGTITGTAIAIGVALFYFWGDWGHIALVLAVFASAQLIESYYLQPKIVGSHVRLHPVWLLLALSVFGSLFGFVGMILAVPLAATLGVLVRFASGKYMESALYTGGPVAEPAHPKMLVEIMPRGAISQPPEMLPPEQGPTQEDREGVPLDVARLAEADETDAQGRG